MLFRSDRKSTRLNSSHLVISYAVFCLKKKNRQPTAGERTGFSELSTLQELGTFYVALTMSAMGSAKKGEFESSLRRVFFLMIRRPPRSKLFPSTTLFR